MPPSLWISKKHSGKQLTRHRPTLKTHWERSRASFQRNRRRKTTPSENSIPTPFTATCWLRRYGHSNTSLPRLRRNTGRRAIDLYDNVTMLAAESRSICLIRSMCCAIRMYPEKVDT